MPEVNTTPRSGFRANSYREVLLGPGAVILNYGVEGEERILGMTRGGNTFNPGVTYRDIESDRPFGMMKGLRVIDEIQPQIVSNLLEIGRENLLAAIPGLREFEDDEQDPEFPDHHVLRMGTVQNEDYFENIAILGTALGYNRPFIGIIKNAIGSGEIELSLENKDESVIEVTFTGTFTGEDLEEMLDEEKTLLEVAPFEMRWPRETPLGGS